MYEDMPAKLAHTQSHSRNMLLLLMLNHLMNSQLQLLVMPKKRMQSGKQA